MANNLSSVLKQPQSHDKNKLWKSYLVWNSAGRFAGTVMAPNADVALGYAKAEHAAGPWVMDLIDYCERYGIDLDTNAGIQYLADHVRGRANLIVYLAFLPKEQHHERIATRGDDWDRQYQPQQPRG